MDLELPFVVQGLKESNDMGESKGEIPLEITEQSIMQTLSDIFHERV